jgi:DNA-binding response OmpR family regulator|tara:strand:- start:74 stop:442 length:369 start_codon:yes stop_codon:yes gene_type:complete
MSRVLVVEDSDSACDLIRDFLESKGYDVFLSRTGEDALAKVRELKPDVMLLDIVLPGIDGMEVLRRVRQFNDKIGIIMVTGINDEREAKEALKKGADNYLTKSINFDYLEMCLLVDLAMRKK